MVAKSLGIRPLRAMSWRVAKLRCPNFSWIVNKRAFLRAVAARDASSCIVVGEVVAVKSEVRGLVLSGEKSSSSSGITVGVALGTNRIDTLV